VVLTIVHREPPQQVQEVAHLIRESERRSGALTPRISRMRYGELRQQGYAVASAAVESAHHGVVQRRLKRPGQRWTEAGARQILAARRLWCNRHSPADVTTVATVRHLIGPPYRGRAAA
jgi:hypothetical protein